MLWALIKEEKLALESLKSQLSPVEQKSPTAFAPAWWAESIHINRLKEMGEHLNNIDGNVVLYL